MLFHQHRRCAASDAQLLSLLDWGMLVCTAAALLLWTGLGNLREML